MDKSTETQAQVLLTFTYLLFIIIVISFFNVGRMKMKKFKKLATILTLIVVLVANSTVAFAGQKNYYGTVGKKTKYYRIATSTIQRDDQGYYKLKVKLFYKTKNNSKKHTNPCGIQVVSLKKYNPCNPNKLTEVWGYRRIQQSTFNGSWKTPKKINGKYKVVTNIIWKWPEEVKPFHKSRTHYFK